MDIELPTYTTIETHGAQLEVFDCDAHEATLTRRGCASRWERAQEARQRRGDPDLVKALGPCLTCPIGALHAGKDPTIASPDYGSDRCPRCGFGTTRMIGNRVCVGCYNREGEVANGMNARGNRPKHLPDLVALQLNVIVDGRLDRQTRTVAVPHTAKVARDKAPPDVRKAAHGASYVDQVRGGPAEAMLAALRTTKGSFAFGWRGVTAYQAAQLEFIL